MCAPVRSCSFPCLPQSPRTPAEEVQFQAALGTMADLYASALSTVVLQLTVVPPMPPEYRGAVQMVGLPQGITEGRLRDALSSVGLPEALLAALTSVNCTGFEVHGKGGASGEARLVCASHPQATELVAWLGSGRDDCADLPPTAKAFLAYNETAYHNRGATPS